MYFREWHHRQTTKRGLKFLSLGGRQLGTNRVAAVIEAADFRTDFIFELDGNRPRCVRAQDGPLLRVGQVQLDSHPWVPVSAGTSAVEKPALSGGSLRRQLIPVVGVGVNGRAPETRPKQLKYRRACGDRL